MDTLSSSVSTFKVHGGLHPTSREPHHLKTARNLLPQLSSVTKRSSSFYSRKTKPHFTTTTPYLEISSSQTLFPPAESSPHNNIVHHKAASGYAAALLDIAQSDNSLRAVEKDVRRLSKLLRNEQLRAVMNVGQKEKEIVVKDLADKGRFQRHLVALLKMLVDKNKVGIVGEMLEEFQRIYDELSGAPVVLVSSAAKMKEDQLFGIAKRVQKLNGGMTVKVRHFIDERLASFAAV